MYLNDSFGFPNSAGNSNSSVVGATAAHYGQPMSAPSYFPIHHHHGEQHGTGGVCGGGSQTPVDSPINVVNDYSTTSLTASPASSSAAGPQGMGGSIQMGQLHSAYATATAGSTEDSPATATATATITHPSSRLLQEEEEYIIEQSEGMMEGDTNLASVVNGQHVAGSHVCVDCGKSFSERSFLLRHRVSHSEAKFVCHLCNRPFVRDDKLKRHIRCVHSSERPYKCDSCPKAFARKDKLQEHARHHNRDITFTCPICSELFVMRSHMNRHLRTVHRLRISTTTTAAGALPIAVMAASENQLQQHHLSVVNGNTLSSMGEKSAFHSVNGLINTSETTAVTSMPSEGICTPVGVLMPIPSNGENHKPSKSRRRSSNRSIRVSHSENSVATRPMLDSSQLQCSPTSLQQQQYQQGVFPTYPVPPPLPLGANVNFPTGLLFPTPSAAGSGSIDQQYQLHDKIAVASQARSIPGYNPQLFAHSQYLQQPDQQAQQQQYHQLSNQQRANPAWSAAMAASLFSPANYVNWWTQPNRNFMLPNSGSNNAYSDAQCVTNSTITAAAATSLPNNESSLGGSMSSQGISSTQPASHLYQQQQATISSLHQTNHPLSQTSQPQQSDMNRTSSYVTPSSTTTNSDQYNNQNLRLEPYPQPTPAHMLASLPGFAQAMYYRAASWVANQNGEVNPMATGGGGGGGGAVAPTQWNPNTPRLAGSYHTPAFTAPSSANANGPMQ